ncbi:putative GABA permease [Xylogone sp. PMI_703]|nr:putative GABA permease [Xylogone sp. PMI_703]
MSDLAALRSTMLASYITDSLKIGTRADHRDMLRMGKTQELRRNFRFLSILGFTCILMSTWEGQFTASTFGLINGGLAGLIWTYLGTFVCFLAVIASMAEMASMAPTSGGQYHWVSEFAPANCQRFLSYITGWVCVLGWQTGITSIAFLTASQIQSLLVINNSQYVFQRYHGTLLIIGVCFFSIIFNTYLARRQPLIEGIVLILHICGFIAILVPLWVLAPRNKASDVFTQFTDGGNWGSIGLSCLIGMLSPVFTFIGPDSATYMSEEIKDASSVLPRAMMWTAIINGSLGFVMLITFCFTFGDIGDILSNPDIMPFVQVFYNTTKSHVGTSIMTTILIILTTCGTITNVTTASRQMFAFARDNGLPFSQFLSHVRPGWDIPLNAVAISFCITIFLLSISCVFITRWRGEELPAARWSLGKYGAPINVFSVLYLLIVYIFSFFPLATPVTPETMNWNALIYGFTVCFAIIYFIMKGRYVYNGPVALARKDM